jgi:hypothetical protein
VVDGPEPKAMALRAALTASMTSRLLGSGVKVNRSATAERKRDRQLGGTASAAPCSNPNCSDESARAMELHRGILL